MTRHEFLDRVKSKMGAVVVWAHKGPDTFDCSGLVTWAANAKVQRSRDMYASMPPVAKPFAGDLAFWSTWSEGPITHVAIVAEDAGADAMRTRIISADGATSALTEAQARESTTCRVREHESVNATGRAYFRGFRKNTLVGV